MSFIGEVRPGPAGLRLAVKDCIDVAGLPTTVGNPRLGAEPATKDAACLAGARAAGVTVVGKTNLSELCHSASGINPTFGTPVNPIDPLRVPGGSSSGSAVAVATGAADVAYGTDTTGSVRIPAAACGVAALKPTNGKVPLDGVFPLSPTCDTVGVLARDVAGLRLGYGWLVPDEAAGEPPRVVLRLRTPGRSVHPEIDAAVDKALADFEVRDLALPQWWDIGIAAGTLSDAEAYAVQRPLVAGLSTVDPAVAEAWDFGSTVSAEAQAAAREMLSVWRAKLVALLRPGVVIALPAVLDAPPLVSAAGSRFPHANGAVNGTGLPAVCVPADGAFPYASVQLVGAPDTEADLLAGAAIIEAT
ncbi:amidase [Fodinicola acaciae]|uniref:amidase n=1 Tax=Fodinicola acaciae TaxID=2681555 RepID=UPI0013D72E53|nr:amidase [Fodinicola acaciae]